MDRIPFHVREAVRTRSDTIDWQKTLQLVEAVNRHPDYAWPAADTIKQIAFEGKRQDRLNCISFLDALFKNGRSEVLNVLQQSPAIAALADDVVVSDPYVHRVLCSNVDQWVAACQRNHCLKQNFVEWQRRLFSFRYRYVMTQAAADKFSRDFSSALELLHMCNQAITTAKMENLGPGDEMLQEMLPNVNEVHHRLLELQPTMPDPYVRKIIDYLIGYCELCKQCYSVFSQTGDVDTDALAEMAARGIPKEEDFEVKRKPVPAQPEMAPAPVAPAPAPPQQQVDDLLDLNFVPTPAQQPEPQPMPSYPQPPPMPAYPQPAAYPAPYSQTPSYPVPPPVPAYPQPPAYPIPQPMPSYPQPPAYPVPQPMPAYPTPQPMPQSQPVPQQPKPSMDDFEFADDVDNGGVNDAQFAEFLTSISQKQ